MVSSHAVIFDKKVSNALAYTSCMYSEALSTKPKLPCILYDTSSHEKTGDIITFAQFEEGSLVVNECNIREDESNSVLIDESSTGNDFNDVYKRTEAIDDIWDGNHVNSGISTRYDKLKIHEHIRKTQSEWKVE